MRSEVRNRLLETLKTAMLEWPISGGVYDAFGFHSIDFKPINSMFKNIRYNKGLFGSHVIFNNSAFSGDYLDIKLNPSETFYFNKLLRESFRREKDRELFRKQQEEELIAERFLESLPKE